MSTAVELETLEELLDSPNPETCLRVETELEGGSYREVLESRVLAGFPIEKASDLVGRPGNQNWTLLANEFVTFIQRLSQP